MDLYVYINDCAYVDDLLRVECYCSSSLNQRNTFYADIDPATFDSAIECNVRILDAIQPQAEALWSLSFTNRFILGGVARELPESVWSTVDLDVGSIGRYGGVFDIATAAQIIGKPVIIQQAPGPYEGKGDYADEAEMDLITSTASVLSASVIRAYWTCSPKGGPIKGHIKFQYAVSG